MVGQGGDINPFAKLRLHAVGDRYTATALRPLVWQEFATILPNDRGSQVSSGAQLRSVVAVGRRVWRRSALEQDRALSSRGRQLSAATVILAAGNRRRTQVVSSGIHAPAGRRGRSQFPRPEFWSSFFGDHAGPICENLRQKCLSAKPRGMALGRLGKDCARLHAAAVPPSRAPGCWAPHQVTCVNLRVPAATIRLMLWSPHRSDHLPSNHPEEDPIVGIGG